MAEEIQLERKFVQVCSYGLLTSMLSPSQLRLQYMFTFFGNVSLHQC